MFEERWPGDDGRGPAHIVTYDSAPYPPGVLQLGGSPIQNGRYDLVGGRDMLQAGYAKIDKE